MRYETPGAGFHARADGFDTGLAGTIGVRIIDSTGTDVSARTTVGIIESPAGSGSYLAGLTAPATSGDYTIFWDNGSVSPSTTAGEQLFVSLVAPSPTPSGDLLASTAELAARLGITLSSDEEDRAIIMLGIASDLVRSQAKQRITYTEDDVWTTRGVWGNRLRFPQRPATNITSISATFLNGTTVVLDPLTYYIDGDELVRYDWPLSFSIGNGWLGPGWELTITYDHGYDGSAAIVPHQLAIARTVVLEAVARVWVNPGGASQSMIGGEQAAFPAVGLTLTDKEKEALADVFRTTAGSVRLR